MLEKNRYVKKLQFMVENGIRQLGFFRIGYFVDRFRLELMYCEINVWQYYIDFFYLEVVNRNKFDIFVFVLGVVLGKGDIEIIEERYY